MFHHLMLPCVSWVARALHRCKPMVLTISLSDVVFCSCTRAWYTDGGRCLFLWIQNRRGIMVGAIDCRSAGPWFNSGWKSWFIFMTGSDNLMNHPAQRYNTMSPFRTVITTITRKSVNKTRSRVTALSHAVAGAQAASSDFPFTAMCSVPYPIQCQTSENRGTPKKRPWLTTCVSWRPCQMPRRKRLFVRLFQRMPRSSCLLASARTTSNSLCTAASSEAEFHSKETQTCNSAQTLLSDTRNELATRLGMFAVIFVVMNCKVCEH